MGLRLFLISFLAGVCAVLLGIVLFSLFLDSNGVSPQTGAAPGQTDSAALPQSRAAQLKPSPTVVATHPAQSLAAAPTVVPEPTEAPVPTTLPTPVATSEPAQLGSPAAPSGLSADYVAGEGIVLTWQAVAGSAYYNIYRSLQPGGGPGATYVALGSSGTPVFRDTTVLSGENYFFVVTASANGLESTPSSEAAVQIP
jgi:hypothetical protein